MTTIDEFIGDLGFPCVGAKTAASKGQIEIFAAGDMRCSNDDGAILLSIYSFLKSYQENYRLFQSLIVTFSGPEKINEAQFENLLWHRLQAIQEIDGKQFSWDPEVASDPRDNNFSLSFGGKAFYIVGMHPGSSRKARAFSQPAFVLNLHEQFEQLRATGAYQQMQRLIRRRDKVFSGSVNPMLTDFGDRSEASQYSGRLVGADWRCPFNPHLN